MTEMSWVSVSVDHCLYQIVNKSLFHEMLAIIDRWP